MGKQSGVPFPPAATERRWVHAGRGESRGDDWCSSPQRFVCTATGEWFVSRCRSSRSSRCEYCAHIKRGDVAAIGRSGWTDKPSERGWMLTLTAPGADVLPWDQSQCNHSGGVPCAGDLGCVVDARSLALWHDGMGARWNHFITDLRRVLKADVQFFKTYEPQRRGALHVHAMLRASGITDRRLKAAVLMVARRNGFGRQFKADPVDLSNSLHVARAAGYCAKYCAKSADALPEVVRLNVHGEVRHGGLRAWSASRDWGDTMRLIDARRMAWRGSVAEERGADHPGAAGALDPNMNLYATGVDGLRIFKADSALSPV